MPKQGNLEAVPRYTMTFELRNGNPFIGMEVFRIGKNVIVFALLYACRIVRLVVSFYYNG